MLMNSEASQFLNFGTAFGHFVSTLSTVFGTKFWSLFGLLGVPGGFAEVQEQLLVTCGSVAWTRFQSHGREVDGGRQ